MSTRRCSKCKVTLPIDVFGKKTQRKDGISLWCKPCTRESVNKYRSTEEGAQKHRAREKARYKAYPELIRRRVDSWRSANLERAREANNAARLRRMQDPEYRKKENARISKWAKNNSARSNARARINRLRRMRATPSWLTAIQKAQIQEFYDIAAARNVQTGVKYHVDHVFAIKGNGWCGLHVPWNLQVITAEENDKKWIKVPKSCKHNLCMPQKHVRSSL